MYRIANLAKVILLSAIINFKSRMIYKWDFLAAIVIKSGETIISYLLLEFMLGKITSIGGFDRQQMILIFGVSELAFSIWHCFFINSLSIGAYVRMGQIDRFLLRPMSTVLQIVIDGFDEDGWGGLIIAIIIIGFATSLGAGPKTFSGWIFILLFAVCGSLIFFSISLLLASASFWVKTSTNLGLVVMDLRVFSRFPATIYPRWFRVILSTLVPLTVCGYWPAVFIIEGGIKPLLIILITTLLFVLCSVIIFNTMLRRSYESAGT